MRTHNRSSLFLMEIMVAILFFALCSAVCVQIFARAHTLNNDSTNLLEASNLAHNIAEVYMNGSLKEHYPYDKNHNLYYDAKWQPSKSHQHFKVHLKLSENQLKIGIFDADENNIYTLNVKKYNQKEVR